MGLPKYCRIVNDKNTPSITLIDWVNLIRGYLEERVLDTFFRIYNIVNNPEIYLLKYWVWAEIDLVSAWGTILLAGVGGAALCNYDLENLNCSGKSIMYITFLDLWD